MCVCGGVLEVGLICAVSSYIAKKIHKCKCKCHAEEDHCCHCEDHKKNNIYKYIQIALGIVFTIGVICLGIGTCKVFHHDCNEHCNHHHEVSK